MDKKGKNNERGDNFKMSRNSKLNKIFYLYLILKYH